VKDCMMSGIIYSNLLKLLLMSMEQMVI